KLKAAHDAAAGWLLVHVSDPLSLWRDTLRDAVVFWNARAPKDGAPERVVSRWREVALPGGLPKESIHFSARYTPNPAFKATSEEPAQRYAYERHLIVAADGGGTWVG